MSRLGVVRVGREDNNAPFPHVQLSAGAALGFSIMVRASGAHRSDSTLQPASGCQLFNLTPIAVVPAVSLIVWWIPLKPVAYALGGLSASSGYLLAVASLFHALQRVPR